MNTLKISLGAGKKTAWLSEAYSPGASADSELIGRGAEMTLVSAAWLGGPRGLPLSPLLVGEPGVGKNRLVYELARRLRKPLYIFQGHEDVSVEDLACAVRFSDSGGGIMDYVLSPLVTAMHEGGICFIDEIGKIRPRALSLLVSVLDERRYIDSTLLGERVHAKPGFRFIAATNTGEVNALPEFIRSRMRPVIRVGHPPREQIDEIVSAHLATEHELGGVLNRFWALWAAAGKRPTPRDALQHFMLAASLRDQEDCGRAAVSLEVSPVRVSPIGEGHLALAFQHLFGEVA